VSTTFFPAIHALAAERDAHQPPQARDTNRQKANDLAREAVGCMGVFGTLVSRSEQPPA